MATDENYDDPGGESRRFFCGKQRQGKESNAEITVSGSSLLSPGDQSPG